MSNRRPWFAFIVHVRFIDDLLHVGGASLIRGYSNTLEDFRDKMCSMPPLVLGEILFGFEPIWGILVAVMRLPASLDCGRGRRLVHDAVDLAVQRGARVIGLGGLTAPATGAGSTLLPIVSAGITITNGNAFTAAVVTRNVQEACAWLGRRPSDTRVAVVGCTGSVGTAASRLLAEAGYRLLLVGRSADRARRLLPDLATTADFAGDFDGLPTAQIILLLTADPTAQLLPEHVSSGTIVIDCAQPPNIAPAKWKNFRSVGAAVIEGGLVTIPNYSCSYDLRLSAQDATFACLAETYLFAREGFRQHSVGRPSVAKARQLEQIAERHGIRVRSVGDDLSIWQDASRPPKEDLGPCAQPARMTRWW